MENHLKKIYSQARRDVGRDWYKYMESIKPKADRLLKAYEDAKLTGDKDLIKKTGKEYGQFLRQQTYMNERYKSMLNTTTTKLANVNEIALSYLNGKMPKIYATNYNQVSEDMTAGISFDLVDETKVKNLIKDNPKLLPTKKLDIPKDKRWNQKAINSQVLQGIIQGESIDKMAKRLTPIMDRNKKSAIRNARTMTTSAQNKGRLDSYRVGQDKGVVLRKVWMATNSERTRAWHAALNGVEAEIDEPFENDYGKIMFPGDPDADPGNVYNCRCTMRAHIIGFRREDGSIKYIEGEEPKKSKRDTDSSTKKKSS
jgi:SPP1 gp7 family putative phage head morphogenesis protein